MLETALNANKCCKWILLYFNMWHNMTCITKPLLSKPKQYLEVDGGLEILLNIYLNKPEITESPLL